LIANIFDLLVIIMAPVRDIHPTNEK
jgi:hypothetical protein